MKTLINNTFSVGSHCNTDSFMWLMGIRNCSSPFSYMFIDIESALFFIENKFEKYTDAWYVRNFANRPPRYERTCEEGLSSVGNIYINKLIYQIYLDSNNQKEGKNISHWKRICAWVHHNLGRNRPRAHRKNDLEAIKRRQSRLLNALRESPETTLLFYIDNIKSSPQEVDANHLNLMEKFAEQYNCRFLLLVPLLNYDKDASVIVNTDNITIIYYKSHLHLEYPVRNIKYYDPDGILANLKEIILNLYDFKKQDIGAYIRFMHSGGRSYANQLLKGGPSKRRQARAIIRAIKKTGIQPCDKDGDAKGHYQTQKFIEEILPKIKQYFKGDVLDVGCGNGRYSDLISNYADNVHGIDPYEIQIDKFKNKKITYERVSIHDFSTQKKFDCIFFVGVFYMLHDPEHTFEPTYPDQRQYQSMMLKKCKDMLADGGSIIIIDKHSREVHHDEGGWGTFNMRTLTKGANLKITKRFLDKAPYHAVFVIE